jgi:hypothetical protein
MTAVKLAAAMDQPCESPPPHVIDLSPRISWMARILACMLKSVSGIREIRVIRGFFDLPLALDKAVEPWRPIPAQPLVIAGLQGYSCSESQGFAAACSLQTAKEP